MPFARPGLCPRHCSRRWRSSQARRAQRATHQVLSTSRPRPASICVNVSGGPAKDYIVDANGNGAAFFDYDNDGDLDALIVNGSTRERIAQGGDPMVALYQNDGTRPLPRRDGRQRLHAARLGIGRLRRRHRQRRLRRTSTSPRSAPTRCGATPGRARSSTSRAAAGFDEHAMGHELRVRRLRPRRRSSISTSPTTSRSTTRRFPRAGRPPTAGSWRPTSSAARSG